MSFLGGKGNNNISIDKAKSKFSFCYHLGCSTTARLLQAHLGCSQTDAGNQHTTRGNTTPILPTSCSTTNTPSGSLNYHQSKADGDAAPSGSLPEPQQPPEGCRHHQTIAGTSGSLLTLFLHYFSINLLHLEPQLSSSLQHHIWEPETPPEQS